MTFGSPRTRPRIVPVRCIAVPIAVLLVALSCRVARADDDGDYRALTAAAVAEHSDGHYEEARVLFGRAHALHPNARTLWGMGISTFDLRRYAEAIVFLRASLEHPDRPLTNDQREQATALIARSEAFVVHARILVRPEGAKVFVDGIETALGSAGEVVVDAGTHQIAATAPGFESVTQEVRWPADATPVLELRLDPEVAATAPDASVSGQGVGAATPSSQDAKPRTLKILKWSALGASAATLAVFATGYGLRQTAAADYNDESHCPEPKRESCSNLRAAVERRELVAIIGGSAAGALAIVAATSFILDYRRGATGAAHSSTCGWTLAPGVVCRFRF